MGDEGVGGRARAVKMPGVGPLETYLEKVRTCAYTITDADVQAVKDAGVSEDEIFERTVASPSKRDGAGSQPRSR